MSELTDRDIRHITEDLWQRLAIKISDDDAIVFARAIIAAHEAQRQAGQGADAWLTPGMDLHLCNPEGYSDWTALYTSPQPAIQAGQDVLTCDFCSAVTPDPWHGSTTENKHIHACEKCLHLLPGHGATPTPMTEDAINNVIGNWFAEDWAIENARGMLRDLGIGKACT